MLVPFGRVDFYYLDGGEARKKMAATISRYNKGQHGLLRWPFLYQGLFGWFRSSYAFFSFWARPILLESAVPFILAARTCSWLANER
jgi:hypothetical protein